MSGMGNEGGVLALAAIVGVALISGRRGDSAPPPVHTMGPLNLRIVRVGQGRRNGGMLSLYSPSMSQWGQGLALEEGASYRVEATIGNTSTRAGQPVAASFQLSLSGTAPGLTFLTDTIAVQLAPSETKVVASSTFTIPLLTGTLAGQVAGILSAGTGIQIASVSLPVDLVLAATIISGTLGIGVPGSGGTEPVPITTAVSTVILGTTPNGSKLASGSITFTWSAGVEAVTAWYLYIGTTGLGSNDILVGSMGLATSRVVSNLPANGLSVYVRLWRFVGAWSSNDYQYVAAG